MDSLRLALAVFGLLVVAGVYLWTRFNPPSGRPPDEDGREPRGERTDVAARRPMEEEGPHMLITLYVLAPKGQAFPGAAIEEAAEALGLVHGPMGIYHACVEGGSPENPVFSMANALEPGTFEPGKLADFSTPGVVFFLKLPGPLPPKQAFAVMAKTADAMARRLGGDVCDESRSKLTAQTVRRLREQVESFALERRPHENPERS